MLAAIPPSAEIGDFEITKLARDRLAARARHDDRIAGAARRDAGRAARRGALRPGRGHVLVRVRRLGERRADRRAHRRARGGCGGRAPLLSFDTTVTLAGVGLVADEDLVRFSAGLFTMVFDGSAQGIPAALDLDAANLEPGSTKLLLSFDGTGASAE